MSTQTPDPKQRDFSAMGRKSKGGGRPPIPESEMTEAQRKRRRYYEAEKAKGGK